METKEKETLKRGEFLRSLGLSTSALMAFYCLGTTMSSCTKDSPDPMAPPAPGGGAPPAGGVTGKTSGSGIDFNVDLTSDAYKELKTEGKFKVIGDTIVIATANNKYVALSKACTHQGNTVEYRSATNDILCPVHKSEFKLDGGVQKGPAASPLTVFTTTLSANGNSLNVKA